MTDEDNRELRAYQVEIRHRTGERGSIVVLERGPLLAVMRAAQQIDDLGLASTVTVGMAVEVTEMSSTTAGH